MLKKPIYIISDLHLGDATPTLLNTFERFIDIKARNAHALYILGDLFEFWVGDDEESPTAHRVAERLKLLSEQGVPVFYMHGNRDFLIGKTFLNQSGMHLLPDPSLVSLDGHDVLMSHGDLLCTQDVSYQCYRWWVHRSWLQKLFLALPLSWRIKIGNAMRKTSQSHGSLKQPSTLDVDEKTVEAWLKHHHVYTLIHGHTHKPSKHFYPLSHPPFTRLVLGAWDHDGQAKIVCFQRGELSLIDL